MIYIVNISCHSAKLPSVSSIYWVETNDRKQAITPTNVEVLERRYQNTTKALSVSTYGNITTI